jgi:hypothetical protein
MKIYVSSTKADLEEYRAALIETIRRLGHEPVHMEHYGPDARRPAEKVQADVAACDVYVCIVAWRYGFIPKGYDCSITELEYRKAVEQKLPMWVFLLADDVPACRRIWTEERLCLAHWPHLGRGCGQSLTSAEP